MAMTTLMRFMGRPNSKLVKASTLIGLVALAGCVVDSVDPETDTDVVDTDVTPECEPLLLTADWDRVVPWGVLELNVSGGSGGVRFALQSDDPDATLNPTTGRLFSGGKVGITYVATVADGACESSASMEITVVPTLEAIPTRATITRNTTFAIEIVGGVGAPECALVASGSGATMAGCTYTSGKEGVDRVRISDPVSGGTVSATYTVVDEAPLGLWGQRWMMPLGSTLSPTAIGGSGHLTLSMVAGESVEIDGEGVIHAIEAGEASVLVKDRFTGAEQTATVRVAEPRIPDESRDGELGNTGRFRGGFDLNGDGYDDVVFGLAEANLGGQGSGGVFVFAGGPDGLAEDPVQVFGDHLGYQDEGGRAIVVADVDKDGEPDLIWSAEAASIGGNTNGVVYVHKGVPGGFFEDAPTQVFTGTNAADRLGSGVAACDFDGDGWDDLAIGAYAAEDRGADRRVNDQGGIFLYRGGPGGFEAEPFAERWGMVPDETEGWVGANMFMGREIAAGDLNGDGLCDVASGVDSRNLTGSGQRGVLVVYTGDSTSGLSRDPVRIVTHIGWDSDVNLGRGMAIGDLNGDGRGELVVGGWRATGSGDDSGVALVFEGGSLTAPGGEMIWDFAEADLILLGSDRSDFAGWALDLQDMDGDGLPDIILGALRDETPDSLPDTGVVWAIDAAALPAQFSGQRLALADVGRPMAYGEDRESYMGQAVGGAGDVNGDGVGDIVAFSGRDSTYGVELGTAFFVDGDTAEKSPLNLPVRPSGHGYGDSMALLDVTGDGTQDLVMGGPGFGIDGVGANSGAVFGYAGARGGWAPWAFDVPTSFSTHGRGDYLGTGLATLDMDGDGYRDLAMVALNDSKPTNYDTTVVNRTDCGGYRSAAGAVLIHRGGRHGLDETPTWIAHGPDVSGRIYKLVGGFDFDGDGVQDLAGSSFIWGPNNEGGFGIIRGRPPLEGGTRALCFDDYWIGTERSAYIGWSISPLGDVDGDGCDDVAVGARLEDFGLSNQGSVRILWGGGTGCARLPRITTMVGRDQSAQAGYAVAGGGDVDGDGIPDLVVGAPSYSAGGAAIGAVWLIPGSYLRTLPAPDAGTELPTYLPAEVPDLLAPGAGRSLVGRETSGNFGAALALVPDPDNARRSLVAVGIPAGNTGGGPISGGVEIYRFDVLKQEFEPAPFAVVVGEPTPFGNLGETLSVYADEGRSVLMVGASDSNVGGPDMGAGYAFPVAAE